MRGFYEVHTIGGLGGPDDLGRPASPSPVVATIDAIGLQTITFPLLGAIAVVVAGTLVYVLHKRSQAR